MRRILSLLFVLSLFYSCSSTNEVIFDIYSQSIISSNDLTMIGIQGKDKDEGYTAILKDNVSKLRSYKVFSLSSISENYDLEIWGKVVKNSEFTVRSNEEYLVTISNRDAAPSFIVVYSDKFGHIYKWHKSNGGW